MPTARFLVPASVSMIVLLAACATAAYPGRSRADDPAAAETTSGNRAEDGVIRIEVKHDRADGGTATIYVQPLAGVRASLGTVGAGESKVFNYLVEAETRTITLIAINSAGQAMVSRETTVPRGAGLVWNLQVNSVRIRSGGG